MNYLPQIVFCIILGITGFFLWKRISRIRGNILMGRDIDRSDNKGERMRNMMLVAFGQKKMFKKMIPALLHLFVYVGFLVINLEVLEFVIDGIAGTHRIFASSLGGFYTVALNIFEFLAVAVIISCVVFLIRRNGLKVRRFTGLEMTAWPRLDANLILITEIALMFAILTMNATDQVLQGRPDADYPETGVLIFSAPFMPLFKNLDTGSLIFIERFAWWAHILGILAFAVYITYSKHMHIVLAFPNTYYASLKPKGEMNNMPEVTKEVKLMLGVQGGNGGEESGPPQEISRFGARDINDLHWKNLMDAYSCTECGRCTAECPANITGKKLSPRKIMMDTRDRMEEVGNSIEKGGKGLEDGKFLLDDYITREELNACTTCNACVEACPVMIDPLSIILQMRRYIVMEESGSPASWNAMFSNIETSYSPWKFPPTDRFKWADDLKKKE